MRQAAVQRNPAAAEAARNVGEAYLAGGNLIAALRELKKAELLNPDDPITMFDIGLVYYYRGRYDQAVDYLQRAIQLKPGYAPAINSLGNTYSSMGEWDKAIEAYERIIEDAFYGTPHFALSNMALAYYQKKEFDQAERYFLEALKMNPDFHQCAGRAGGPVHRAGPLRRRRYRGWSGRSARSPKSPSCTFISDGPIEEPATTFGPRPNSHGPPNWSRTPPWPPKPKKSCEAPHKPRGRMGCSPPTRPRG
jgi:tetratricopeptide (TPR) repeat protein